jgi:hypothetical protein
MYYHCKNRRNANSLLKQDKMDFGIEQKRIILVDLSLCIKFAVVICYDEFHSYFPAWHCCISG